MNSLRNVYSKLEDFEKEAGGASEDWWCDASYDEFLKSDLWIR